MKLTDYLQLACKFLLLFLWLLPLATFFYLQLADIVGKIASFTNLLQDAATMILLLLLTFLPAVTTAYVLSTGSRRIALCLLFIGMSVWLIPMNEYNYAWQNIELISSTSLHQIMHYLIKLFPLTVAGITLLIFNINQNLFDLSRYNQLPIYILIYRYFMPLLVPGLWAVMALSASLIPSIYYTNTYSASAQLSHIIFTLPLVLLAYNIDKYSSVA